MAVRVQGEGEPALSTHQQQVLFPLVTRGPAEEWQGSIAVVC